MPKLTYTCHIVSWLLLSTVTKIMLSHERNPWYNSRWSPSHPSVPSPDFPEGLTRILVSLSSSWCHHILPELRSHSVNELLIVVELDQRSASLAIGYTSLKLLVPLNTGWNSTALTVWFWLWCRSGREFFLQHFLVLSFYLEFLTTAVHASIFFFSLLLWYRMRCTSLRVYECILRGNCEEGESKQKWTADTVEIFEIFHLKFCVCK